MATELVLRKRASTRAGEVGLFLDSVAFEEEFSSIPHDAEVEIEAVVRGTEKYIKFSHVIAKVVFDNSELFASKEDARDSILIDCRHVRRVMFMGKPELRPKRTATLDATQWVRLIRRMVDIATTVHGIPPETFERDMPQGPIGDDPPPHDVIPEGPGIGSNARAMAGSADPEVPADKAAPKREAAPEPPQAAPEATLPAAKEPQVPTTKEQYPAWAQFRLDRFADHAEAMEWLIGDEQWQFRSKLGVSIGVRKSLERYTADKFGGAK